MPEYLVELYSVKADADPAALARLGDGTTVRYLRSILIPGDETCLHLVEADSVEQVAAAFERAGLGADRIVEAVGLTGAHGNRHPEEEVMTKLRFAGLIALVVVAASIAAASAQTQTLKGHGRKGSRGLELTYTKWFAPGYPNMV